MRMLQNDLHEGETLAGTEINITKYLGNLLKNCQWTGQEYHQKVQTHSNSNAGDEKTAMPLKESHEFMEYNQEHIDVLTFHHYPGDKVWSSTAIS